MSHADAIGRTPPTHQSVWAKVGHTLDKGWGTLKSCLCFCANSNARPLPTPRVHQKTQVQSKDQIAPRFTKNPLMQPPVLVNAQRKNGGKERGALHPVSDIKTFAAKTELSRTEARQALVDTKGVSLAAVAGTTATLTGQNVNVKVTVRAGRLSDLPYGGYHIGKHKDGANVVPPHNGNTFVSQSHAGTHSMTPCHPAIIILRDPETKELSVSLTHCVGSPRKEMIAKIEKFEKEGLIVEKVISGIHEYAYNLSVHAQEATMQGLADFTQKKKIDFGVIEYKDAGKGPWWISVDVSDKQSVKIDIGSDRGLNQGSAK